MNKIFKILLIITLFIGIGVFVFLRFRNNESQITVITSELEKEIENKEVEREKEDVNTTLVAGGDVMLSRHVGTKIRRSGDNALPFRNVYKIFNEADIAFINLESPFYNQGGYVTEGMTFKSEPETIEGLNSAGIDIVSLANNHARNQREIGLLYTFDYLYANGIRYVGSGRNYEEAHQYKILRNKNIKFAFLAYTYSDGINTKSSVTKNDPDVAFMDLQQMKKDVEKAKKNSDAVIVSMHAGIEYKSYPNEQQKEFAREAIDSGAKLVLGHHPHVVQSTEKYNNGYIIYSMGNLVFDQMWSQETREGLIVKCKFINSSLDQLEFLPIIIEDYSQPRLASEAESEKILNRVNIEKTIIDL